jgi:uncharacterized protein (DUF302 family)
LTEDKIGTMLPCNVIVQEKVAGQIEVSAVDLAASMQAVENDKLAEIATEIRNRLKKNRAIVVCTLPQLTVRKRKLN